MARTEKTTRLALLRAAERLFAERGVDSVSLREIAVAAGQRNHSAAVYHFKDKRGLVNAVLERHSDPIQAAWPVALEHLGAEGRETLEEIVALLVRPLVRKLDDKDGGADYLIVVSQLVSSRTFPLTDLPATNAPGIMALTTALLRHIDNVPAPLMPLRMMRVASVLYGSIASYHRLVTLGFDIPRDDFVNDLIASLVGMLRSSARAPG